MLPHRIIPVMEGAMKNRNAMSVLPWYLVERLNHEFKGGTHWSTGTSSHIRGDMIHERT